MNTTSTVTSTVRLAVACAFMALAACGGGGGGDDTASSPPPTGTPSPPPAPGPAPPPGPAPAPPPSGGTPTSIQFAAGKRWLYDVDRTNTVIATSTGVQSFPFVGKRVLHAVEELQWQGRTAWKLRQYDLKNAPGASPGLEVATMYVSQTADGVDKWLDSSTGGEWRRILSRQSSNFDNNTFLMAGGPSHDDGTELTSSVSITTPSGTYSTVVAHHDFTETGTFATRDIFEERDEYYADGVGLVRAAWDYSFDDNDPRGTDLKSVGIVDLRGVDTGPVVVAESEPNDDGTAAAADAAAASSIVTAATHHSDPGRIVANTNVAPNISGLQLLQDWYRFEVTAAGARHVALVYDAFNFTTRQYDDLDLYLFREGAGGVLTFVGRSVLDPSTNEGSDGEWIAQNLTAGAYYVAVQAWNTPSDPVTYTLSIR
jgi:hypothetical protein